MHVFVLPSWYPSRRQPMAGLFARDQALAVARARPDWRVTVGIWGHHDGALSLRDLPGNLRALAWRARARGGWRELASDGATDGPSRAVVHEHLTPRLSWTLALAGGGVRGLLTASRANLQAAEARFGPVDVVHAHVGFPAGWIGAQLAQDLHRPLVLTEHMSPFPFPSLRQPGGDVKTPLRSAFEKASRVVAVSPSLAGELRTFDLRCDAVIPNVVDESRFLLVPEPTRPVQGLPFVFFTLGALRVDKGFDVLLNAFARLPAESAVALHVGGDGPERVSLQQLAVRLGVHSRVRWLGSLPPAAVPGVLQGCHGFVLPSRRESFGVVLAEALLAGRPVVATRCGGPESIVSAGDGELVPPEDPTALAAALQAVMSGRVGLDPPAVRRARAVARFGRSAVGEQVASLLEQAVAGP